MPSPAPHTLKPVLAGDICLGGGGVIIGQMHFNHVSPVGRAKVPY